VGRARSIFLANDIPAFAATCRMLGAFDLRAELSSIRVPTAVVVGEEDYATPPEMARVLHHGIAGATLDIIPEARHLTFIEKPDVVASILTNLIQRTA
jgi:3-oxoadipate enol-lactonase